MPAPEASSSTACANAVAMTGRWAVTASMSTPEVTCSWESYGRITTSADAASELSDVDVEVAGLEGHHVRDAQSAGASDATRLGTPHRRVRAPSGASHPPPGSGAEARGPEAMGSASMTRSMPLPGPRRPHVSIRRTSPIRSSGTAVAPTSGAVRDHDDLGVVDVVVIDEPLARRRGHRDQRARPSPIASSTSR